MSKVYIVSGCKDIGIKKIWICDKGSIPLKRFPVRSRVTSLGRCLTKIVFFKDLPHYYFIDKDLKGTVVNRECNPFNGSSLEITSTVKNKMKMEK